MSDTEMNSLEDKPSDTESLIPNDQKPTENSLLTPMQERCYRFAIYICILYLVYFTLALLYSSLVVPDEESVMSIAEVEAPESQLPPMEIDCTAASEQAESQNWILVQTSTDPPIWIYVYANRSDLISWQLINNGTWQEELCVLIKDTYEYNSTSGESGTRKIFFDVGANIGVFTLYAATLGWDVTAFEPMPSNLMMLHSSICLNNLQDRITLYPFGLYDKRQNCAIKGSKGKEGTFVGNGNLNCDLTEEELQSADGDIITVDRLSPYLPKKERIDLFKIDIEGTELIAMESGYPGWNENKFPTRTIFECGAHKAGLNGRSTSTWESIAKKHHCFFNLLYGRIQTRFVISNQFVAHFVLDRCGGADIEMICKPDGWFWFFFVMFLLIASAVCLVAYFKWYFKAKKQ